MIEISIILLIFVVLLSIGIGYARGHVDGFKKGMDVAKDIYESRDAL